MTSCSKCKMPMQSGFVLGSITTAMAWQVEPAANIGWWEKKFGLHSTSNFNGLQSNSLRNGTGNFFGVTGNLFKQQGNSRAGTGIRPRTNFLTLRGLGTVLCLEAFFE